MHTLLPDDLVRLKEHKITLLAPRRPVGGYECGPTQFLAEIDSRKICHAVVIDFDERDREFAEQHWSSQLELQGLLKGESWIQEVYCSVPVTAGIVVTCEELQDWASFEIPRSYEEVRACLAEIANGLLRMRSQGFSSQSIRVADIKVGHAGRAVIGALVPWIPTNGSESKVHASAQSTRGQIAPPHAEPQMDNGHRGKEQGTGIALLVSLAREMSQQRICADPRMHELVATLREVSGQYGDSAVGNALLYLAHTEPYPVVTGGQNTPRTARTGPRGLKNKHAERISTSIEGLEGDSSLSVSTASIRHSSIRRVFNALGILLVATALVRSWWWSETYADIEKITPVFFAQQLGAPLVSQLIQDRYDYLSQLTHSDSAENLTPNALIDAPTVVQQTVQTAKEIMERGYRLERPVVSIIDTVVVAEDSVTESTILVTYGVSYVLDQAISEAASEPTPTTFDHPQQVRAAGMGRAGSTLIQVGTRIKTLERATLHIKLDGHSWKLTSAA